MGDGQKIRTASGQRLGIELPQPHDDRFAQVMQQLEVQAPDLFWQLRGALMESNLDRSSPAIEPPAGGKDSVFETQRRVVRSRAQLADLVQRFFYYRDQVTEQWVLDNRKLLVAVVVGVMAVGWGYTSLARWLAPAQTAMVQPVTPVPAQPEVVLPVSSEPEAATSLPPVAPPPVVPAEPAPVLVPASWPQVESLPLPELPAPSPQPPLMGVYQTASPPAGGVTLAAPRSSAGPLSVVVPDQKVRTVQVAQAATTSRLSISAVNRSGQVNLWAAEAAPALPDPLPVANPAVPAQKEPLAQVALPRAGSLREGELVLGIGLVEGAGAPVVARDTQGGLWLGRASLDRARRVQVAFDRWVQQEGVTPRAASAYSGGLPGLPAEIRDETPALAADLLRGALAGVAQYARVAAQQTRWRSEGGGVLETILPDLGTVVGGAIADLFAVQPGEKALVRLAVVAQGTPLQIVVGVSGVRQTE